MPFKVNYERGLFVMEIIFKICGCLIWGGYDNTANTGPVSALGLTTDPFVDGAENIP